MKLILALMVGLLAIGCSKPERAARSGGSFEPSPSVTPSPSESPKPKVTPYVEPTLTPQQVTLAKQLLSQIKTLEKQGTAMQPLRVSSDLNQGRKCGELMRQRQPIAAQLEEKANTLPTASPVRANLAIAATNLKICVSCSDSQAPTYCKNAREYIGYAQTAIADLGK